MAFSFVRTPVSIPLVPMLTPKAMSPSIIRHCQYELKSLRNAMLLSVRCTFRPVEIATDHGHPRVAHPFARVWRRVGQKLKSGPTTNDRRRLFADDGQR